jgi:zinc transporter, ZIP family
LLASITAVATGVGAVPFFFFKKIPSQAIGYANALAAGLMLAASFKLLEEGIRYDLFRCIGGMIAGILIIHFVEKLFPDKQNFNIGSLKGANALKALLIVGVMTLHSFAEGIGIGVSFSGEENFGLFISIAIAVHNIPEGLAISIVLIPKNVSPLKAMFWSIFSSIPQPLLAIPAYLFVETFQQYLPVGLGLAAGAMIWMVFAEIIPDAMKNGDKENIALNIAIAIAAMIIFQELIRA